LKLPNRERAVNDIRKIRDYSLNPNHPEVKHKARVFKDKLEFTAADAERLRELILEAISKTEATEQQPSPHGRKFYVDFHVTRSEKYEVMGAAIRTAWIIRNDEDFPRLTTCFILRRRP
jgi:hypothetical protein